MNYYQRIVHEYETLNDRILTPRVAFPAPCVDSISDNAGPALGLEFGTELEGRRTYVGLESRNAKRYNESRIQAAGIAR